jgi:3-hydroxyisobutyrate dehydrogenase-like beta-hydroxyacid dehydrogenase
VKDAEPVLLCEARMLHALGRRLRAKQFGGELVGISSGPEMGAFVACLRRGRGARRARTVVNLCPISSVLSVSLSAESARLGAAYLDAPLTGTVRDAARGSLTVIASGPKAAFERAKPALDAIGNRVFYLSGRPGDAQLMHQINGSLASTLLAVACEVYVTGIKAGLNVDTMTQVFSNGSGRNAASAHIVPQQVTTRRFRHGKRIAEACNELALMNQEADREGVTLWVGGKVRQLYALASRLGRPGDDITRLITHYEKWAKVEVKAAARKRT